LGVILHVDDNPDDQDLISAVLGPHAVDVVTVADGEAAIEFLHGRAAGASPVACVLLDLHLPKLDGFAVLRSIRADPRTADLPVVIFSSSGTQGDLERGMRLGCDRFIWKSADLGGFETAARLLGAVLAARR